MKISFIITFIILLTTMSFGQDRNNADKTKVKFDSLKNSVSVKVKVSFTKELEKNVILSKDILNNLLEIKSEKTSSFDMQKNMPWIGAIFIGVFTVIANYIINNQIRKTNIESLNRQLANTREINQKDFNKTVLSGNRQVWINDLRDIISKILSKTLSLSLKKSVTHDELQELIYLISKTELMLNPEKDIDFVTKLKELELCFIDIQSCKSTFLDIDPFISSVKNFAKTTLKTEWERVKKGE